MKLSLLTAAFVLIVFPAFAQQPQPYVPLDQAQWEAMDRDIHKAPMSEEAHQFVHQVMAAYQRDTPALSQAITPTWTGLHAFSAGLTSNGSTSVVGAKFSLSGNQSALAGVVMALETDLIVHGLIGT